MKVNNGHLHPQAAQALGFSPAGAEAPARHIPPPHDWRIAGALGTPGQTPTEPRRAGVEVFEYEFETDDPQGLQALLDEAFQTGNLAPVLALFEA